MNKRVAFTGDDYRTHEGLELERRGRLAYVEDLGTYERAWVPAERITWQPPAFLGWGANDGDE